MQKVSTLCQWLLVHLFYVQSGKSIKKKMWPILKETECFHYLKIAQIYSIASTTYSNYKAD